jgi:hypothetical protein
MDKLSDQTKQKLFQALIGDISIADFEQWLYANDNKLETELNSHFYLDLISLSYNQKGSFSQLKDKIFQYIDINEFNIWRTKKLLNAIIENKIEFVTATRELRDLYFETDAKLIPATLGVYYESELDDVPIPSEYKLWNDQGLKEKLKKVDLYKDDFIKDAKDFLATLE